MEADDVTLDADVVRQGSPPPDEPLDSDDPRTFMLERRGAISACSLASDADHFRSSSPPASGSGRMLRRGGISVERDERRDIHVTFSNGSGRGAVADSELPADELHSGLTTAELTLLTRMNTSESRPRRTGRFLTLHWKQRPGRLRRRGSLEEGLSEGGSHQRQTMKVLSQTGRWNFNTFILDNVTGGRSLPTLLFYLFQQYGLIEAFHLDVVLLWRCLRLIEDGYHSKNPYHNAVHATDVTQAMNCFLKENKINKHLTKLEILTSLVAAVTHDLDHPGVNQPFLIATSNHLAALYKNSSVLENHHWRSALCCLIQSGVLNHLSKREWEDITFHIRSLILATDITRQTEFLGRFKHYMDDNLLDLGDQHNRHFVLQIALKCADICNPCRPWEISTRWSQQVCEEFFQQGDVERRLNLPVTSLCDRNSTTIARIQSGFFRFVVTPLFEEWNHFLQTPLSSMLVENLRCNQKKWDNLVALEESEQLKQKSTSESSSSTTTTSSDCTPPALTEPETAESSDRRSSDDEADEEEDEDDDTSFPLPSEQALGRRRHSVPISLAATATGPTASHLHHLYHHLALRNIEVGPSPSWPSSSAASIPHGVTKMAPVGASSRAVPLRSHWSSSSSNGTDEDGHVVKSGYEATSQSSTDESPLADSCPNGCGTPTESSDGEILSSASSAARRSRGRPTMGVGDRRGKPLLRLKSDSDLLELNGKIFAGSGRSSLETSREDEKENEEPTSPVTAGEPVTWRGAHHRSAKPQGVGMIVHRMMGRRGSAPVGLLREDIVNGLRGGAPSVTEEPRRRDSAPMLVPLEELCRVQNVYERVPSVAPANPAKLARRGSLPADILLNAVVDAVLPRREVPSPLATAELLEAVFQRRRSMPTTDLFPRSRSGTNNGADWPPGRGGGLWCSPCVLVRQAQSFDRSALLDPLLLASVIDGAGGCSSSKASRKLPYPFRRRASVPAEACLFSMNAKETDMMVEIT